MSFQTGKMGVAEGIGLVFVITFCKVFLSLPAQSTELSAGLSWISPILSGLPVLGAILMLNYVFRWFPGDIYSISVKLLGKWGAWIICLAYSGIFLSNAALLMRQFAENTLLTALPNAEFSFIIIFYGVAAGLLVYLGIEAIARSSYLLLPFICGGMLVILLLLSPMYNTYNLTPWKGNGLAAAAGYGLLTAAANIGALVPVIFATAFQNFRTLNLCALFGLGISLCLKGLFFVVYLMVFGVAFAQEKTLPFFETARLVYLSRYLQRIEAIFILLWVIVGVISIAISLYVGIYLISRLLNLPAMSPLVPVVMLALVQAAMIPADVVTTIELDSRLLTTYHNFGVYFIPGLLFAAAWFKKLRKKKVVAG